MADFFYLLTSCQIPLFTQQDGSFQWNGGWVAHFIHMQGRADVFMFVVFRTFGSSFLLHFVMKRLATNRKERVP